MYAVLLKAALYKLLTGPELKLAAADRKSGLAALTVEAVQGESSVTLLEEAYPGGHAVLEKILGMRPVPGYFDGDLTRLRLGAARDRVRLPWYVRLDLRESRAVMINGRRLSLFAELVNALGRRNLGQADGFIRLPGLEAEFYTEKLIPRIPSAGFV